MISSYSEYEKKNFIMNKCLNMINEVLESRSVVLWPQVRELLVRTEDSAYAKQTGWHFLHVQAKGSPSEPHVVSPVVVDLHHNLCVDVLVVPDCQVEISIVPWSIETSSVVGNLVSWDVEGVTSSQGDVLVFGSVVNAVFSNELKRSVGWVFLENSDCSFGKRHS